MYVYSTLCVTNYNLMCVCVHVQSFLVTIFNDEEW